MLQLVFDLFNFLQEIIYFGLLFSYKTGQAIVSCITVVLDVVVRIMKSLQTLTNVLFEDFRLFFWCDVRVLITNCISVIISLIQSLISGILIIVDTVKTAAVLVFNGIISVYNSVFHLANYIHGITGSILVFFKHWLMLLGAGIWFAVTFIPLLIVYISTMSTYYIGLVLSESFKIISFSVDTLKTGIMNSYYFICDFPIDSLLGLIVGCSLTYAIFKMHELCIQTVRSFLARVQLRLSNFRRQQEVEAVTSSDIDTSESETEVDAKNNTNFCIICEERDKCILMLPCRHLCICYTCNLRLQYYNRTCPICRTLVQKTMKVFT